MTTSTANEAQSETALAPGERRRVRLRHTVEHAAHLLPAQGPISVFVHHNTLHAFEDLKFDEAVKLGGRTYGCHPYLPEEEYRKKLETGRILPDDLAAVLMDELGDEGETLLGPMGTRFHLRLAMLQSPLRQGPAIELRWFIEETDALRHIRPEAPVGARKRLIERTRRWVMKELLADEDRRDGKSFIDHRGIAHLIDRFGATSIDSWSDATWEEFALNALWRIARAGCHASTINAEPEIEYTRHRDYLLHATGVDTDELVNELLIRYSAAFLDQGLAHWPLPNRELGFYQAFFALYQQRVRPPDPWLRGLRDELDRLSRSQVGPEDSILESLDILGVSSAEMDKYLAETLLALRGWAGMLWQAEVRSDRVSVPVPKGTLIEYLAVRLILVRLAVQHQGQQSLGFYGPLTELREVARQRIPKQVTNTIEQRAFLVFQLAQLRQWSPSDLYVLTRQGWARLVQEIESFSQLDRRRVFHQAFERRYRINALEALSQHAVRPVKPMTKKPRFQIVTCIDDREESFKRHLEEIDPEVETFGTAGFFAVPMYFRGVGDASFVPLCPIVIRPQHWVAEDVLYTFGEVGRRRAARRQAFGAASRQLHVGSRKFLGGILTALFGALASVPLVFRVLFPRFSARVRSMVGAIVRPPELTHLDLERAAGEPSPEPGHHGYTVDEMSAMVERMLRDIGLTTDFARLVLVVGHGSSSLNNPHESAYNCGACGGGRGGPNARAFAHMANDPRIRAILSQRGLTIPQDTYFVGAYHNTCNDDIVYWDLERLPSSHYEAFDGTQQTIDRVRERNAHERCRRFQSAPLSLSPEAALRHVQARAQDLAQTRPEFNHASNAMCIVGRRARTKGLYLDRRSFLASYDPLQDDEQQSILFRTLSAVVPVCAGINLEYYFSTVDTPGYGCGTKLPHNITSLIGVMDGAASDLRTGLSAQMCEIHEPIRLLFVIEATPEAMLDIMKRNETINRLCRHGWVQLAVLDPHSAAMHVFHKGEFHRYQPQGSQLPHVPSSIEWYGGSREHLDFAVVDS